MRHTVAEIMSAWLHDEAGRPKRTHAEHGKMYSLEQCWEDARHARVALTSMSMQLCQKRLRVEQRRAVKGACGLHGSALAQHGHREPSWDDIGQDTVTNVNRILTKYQPLALKLLTELATPVVKKNDDTGTVVARKSRPPGVVATEVLSTLNFSRTRFARLLPTARSVMYFACGIPRSLFDYGSQVGQTLSWSATYRMLQRLAAQERKVIAELGWDRDRWPIMRIDNVQQYHKQRDRRMGRENVMEIGVAGTVAEALEFEPSAADLDDRRQRIAQNPRKGLTVNKLVELVDWDYSESCFVLQWVQVLVRYVPALAGYRTQVADLYRTDNLKMSSPASHTKTPIHALGTVAKNEAIMTDLRDTLVDFLGQLGQTDTSHMPRLLPVGGDGLTFEKLVQIKNQLQFQDNDFRRFDIVMPFLETWHTQWTYLSMIFEVHFGKRFTTDPSALGHSAAKIDQKEPSNLKKVDYYPACYLAYIVLDARLLDCWRIHYNTDDLFQFFDKLAAEEKLPTLDELRDAAKVLHARYSCQRAWYNAMEGEEAATEAGWTMGTAWTSEPSSVTAKSTATTNGGESTFTGDRSLAQSILFIMDTMLSRDAAEAVAVGDVGRLWNDLKIMMFKFEGSSHTKYGGYMLEQTCSLELEASESLRRTFLKNWLVNPTGRPGKTLEGDLFEEHINEQLEDAITRKDADWDNPFLREVISPNVYHFIELKDVWGAGVGLARRRGHHPDPHSRPEIRKLLETYRSEQLHVFRSGRSYEDSVEAVNTFAKGVRELQKKKLKRFILESTRAQARTTRPASNPQHEGCTSEGQPLTNNVDVGRDHAAADSEEESERSNHSDEELDDDVEPVEDDLSGDPIELTGGSMQLVDGELVVGYYEYVSGQDGMDGDAEGFHEHSEDEDILDEGDDNGGQDADSEVSDYEDEDM
ncbi:hypothetical protein C8Q73DRAFT_828246 [Cubamyces lactineus]|nr:hypothetical protein C8Q73DRAFT_828240 [Cubamyces lactineus]KAH9893371.1 hypothetical protein C8Q73DRAFT_828246 [Cubamyces lactineus]